MKSPSENLFSGIAVRLLLVLLAVVLVVVGVMALRQRTPQLQPVVQARLAAPATNLPSQTPMTSATKSPTVKSGVSPNWTNFQERPFPVAYESAKFQWTLADGKETNVIKQLAHNPLEYGRMVRENSEIFRRQLVYLKETAAAVYAQANLTGAAVTQMTLPGLDGQELTVDVTRTDLKDGGNQGQVYGKLPGQPDSMVTVAFVGDREAFTVISHRDQIYLLAESHDPSQIVVKSVNPLTYGTPQK